VSVELLEGGAKVLGERRKDRLFKALRIEEG
jgi:hypothetical protein